MFARTSGALRSQRKLNARALSTPVPTEKPTISGEFDTYAPDPNGQGKDLPEKIMKEMQLKREEAAGVRFENPSVLTKIGRASQKITGALRETTSAAFVSAGLKEAPPKNHKQRVWATDSYFKKNGRPVEHLKEAPETIDTSDGNVSNPVFPKEVRETFANPNAPTNGSATHSFPIGSVGQQLPSEENLAKHYADLLLPENMVANGSFELNAINNVDVLKCLAEINCSEYDLGLDKSDNTMNWRNDIATKVSNMYCQQLANFEDKTMPALQEAKVSQAAISTLHEIYKFRACMPLTAIMDETKYIRFQEKINNFVLRKSIHPPSTTFLRRVAFQDPSTHVHMPVSIAIEQFKGYRALMQAMFRDGGLTQDEVNHIYNVLAFASQGQMQEDYHYKESASKLVDKPKEGSEYKQKIDEILAIKDNREMLEAASNFVKTFRSSSEGRFMRGFTTNYVMRAYHQRLWDDWNSSSSNVDEKAISTLEESNRVTYVDLPRVDAVEQSKGLVDQFQKALKEDPKKQQQNTRFLEAAVNTMEAFLEPDQFTLVKLLELVNAATPYMNDFVKEKLFEPFLEANPQTDVEDSVIHKVMTMHPMADRVTTRRLDLLAKDEITYDHHEFDSAKQTVFRHREHNVYSHPIWADQLGLPTPELKDGEVEIPARWVDNPPEYKGQIPEGYPYNSAIEHVTQLRIEVMATQYLGFDLNKTADLMMFKNLCESYELSPGEETLERCVDVLPAHHTFEELPIIKKDGWAECDAPTDYPEYAAYLAEQKSKQAEE